MSMPEALSRNERQIPATARRYLRVTVAVLLACDAADESASAQWMGKQEGCYADSMAEILTSMSRSF